jgi:hypothetical protein
MPRKGHKSTKGIGDLWGEPKKNRININLTDTGKQELERKAESIGISVSELIERIARGQLVPQEDPAKKNFPNLWILLNIGIQIPQEHQNETT